jgi:hypothetical protein
MALAGVLGSLLGIPVVFALSGLMCVLAGLLAFVGLPAVTLKDKVDEVGAVEEAEAQERQVA